MGGRFATALDVFVTSQSRLPPVSFSAVPAFELPTGVVGAVAVAFHMSLVVVLGFEQVADRVEAPRVGRVGGVVEGVRLFWQNDVVRVVVVLRVRLVRLAQRVIVLQKGLLEQVRLEVVRDVEGHFGKVEGREGPDVFAERGFRDAGELDAGRHERRQRLRLRARRQQRQQSGREVAILV